MSAIYDNWERLVAAVLKREELWQLFHAHSRSPSILSEASDSSLSFDLGSSLSYRALDASLQPKLVLLSDFSPAFDVKHVCQASAELLGRGTFGSAYSAAMDNGVTIVAKRLKPGSISELGYFKRHMDIVGSVRHENVAPLRAYYSFKDERILLYDYYREGSVYALLHGQLGKNPEHLDWNARFKIAIGAARGIAHIHAQNGGKLVRGNIKSSNTFLNPQKYGCVSDLGLANVVTTTLMPHAQCHAPEVKNTKNVSQASDVYGFGILLLELLTRKSSVHVPGGPKAVNLVKLVSSVKSKERAAKVFDADLLWYPTIKEGMVKMLLIGKDCVAKSIEKKPKMYEVVKMLEDMLKISVGSRISRKQNFVLVEDVHSKFNLEDMLSSYSEVLGEGTFGISYKSQLENGNTIMVKRLKDRIVTLKDFRRHVEVHGRMRHENVATLMAYCCSWKEKLLVYYYHQDSVYALLHVVEGIGIADARCQYLVRAANVTATRTAFHFHTSTPRKSDTVTIPLSWKIRLKIAIGAARGIAYIHGHSDQKLVHGHVKSSNIFVDGSKYGIVSDVGIAKLMYPIKLSVTEHIAGHCAPEVKSTRFVSQASDVYNFGVVLLELVSGRASMHMTSDGDFVSLVQWIQYLVRNGWIAEVFDKDMRYQTEEKGAMVNLLQIAMDCISSLARDRPTMPEVAHRLEEISGVESSNESRLEDTREQPSIESRLEDLVESLLPTITP